MLPNEANSAAAWGLMTEQSARGASAADALPADFFAQIVDGAVQGICCVDVEGNTTYVNPAAAALLGFPRQDLLGVPMHTAIHPGQPEGQRHPKERCPLHQAVSDGATPRTRRDVFWRADGTSFPVEYVSRPLLHGTAVVGAVFAFQGIGGHQRELEARLLSIGARAASAEAEAADSRRLYAEAQELLRTRDEFLSLAAHELRTPVTALRGFAQLGLRRLKRGIFDPERERMVLEEIDGQTTQLNDLVNQLLEISRLDIGSLVINREPMDVVAAVTAASQAVRASAAHVLAVRAPASLDAFLDAARIQQVLVSLVTSAVKFSPEGGVIDVDVTSPLPNTGQITVRDHGTALPAERRDRLFDRFVQPGSGEHASGLGLDLYLSRQITELHGGTLTVDAPPGGGTRFTLLFPLRPGADAVDPASGVPRPPSSGVARATSPAPQGAATAVRVG
jgi:two-component system, OmpR family, sensor histidine kinase VicK